MTIQIPNDCVKNFGTFFTEFEKSLSELGVDSYGITLSTLEDVFLKIGHSLDPIKSINEKIEAEPVDLMGSIIDSSFEAKES
jgi:hypothetical protein